MRKTLKIDLQFQLLKLLFNVSQHYWAKALQYLFHNRPINGTAMNFTFIAVGFSQRVKHKQNLCFSTIPSVLVMFIQAKDAQIGTRVLIK